MTKQRRLAIQMWQEIVDKCRARDDFNLVEFKKEFCKEHNLHWINNCYFCQYFLCSECPLDKNCFLYEEVYSKHDVASATVILNTLKGVKNEI